MTPVRHSTPLNSTSNELPLPLPSESQSPPPTEHHSCLYPPNENNRQFSPSISSTQSSTCSLSISTSKTWICTCGASVGCGASSTAKSCSICAPSPARSAASPPHDCSALSSSRTRCQASRASCLLSSRLGFATTFRPSDMNTGIRVSTLTI